MVTQDTRLVPITNDKGYRGIYADVIVHILAHLHTALRTEGNLLDTN